MRLTGCSTVLRSCSPVRPGRSAGRPYGSNRSAGEAGSAGGAVGGADGRVVEPVANPVEFCPVAILGSGHGGRPG
nr:hypothetical protein KPHV_22020 [Kitasatospora purpeofusca]